MQAAEGVRASSYVPKEKSESGTTWAEIEMFYGRIVYMKDIRRGNHC